MGEETYSILGPKCPHCGFEFTPDEPHYFDESNYTEEDCPECKGTFEVEVYTSTSWTCTPILCGETDPQNPTKRARQ